MKYEILLTSAFKKELKLIKKRNKDLKKLSNIIDILASGEELDKKFNNHLLFNNSKFRNCYECHIEPDWLLIYKIINNELILLLIETGTHSDLFK